MSGLIASRDSTESVIVRYKLPCFENLSSQLSWRDNAKQIKDKEALFIGRVSLKGGGPRPSRYGQGQNPTYQSIVVVYEGGM